MSTVLITGANRGLGLEFVRQYNRAGWRVIACGRSQSEALNELAAASPHISLYSVDVADHASIDRLASDHGDDGLGRSSHRATASHRVRAGDVGESTTTSDVAIGDRLRQALLAEADEDLRREGDSSLDCQRLAWVDDEVAARTPDKALRANKVRSAREVDRNVDPVDA